MCSAVLGVGRRKAMRLKREDPQLWVIQSAAVWPRWTVRCTRLCCSAESRARLLRQVKSTSHAESGERRLRGEQGRSSNAAAHYGARLRLLSDVTSLLSLPFSPFLSLSRTLSLFPTNPRARARAHALSLLTECEDRKVRMLLLLLNYFCLSFFLSLSFYYSWALIHGYNS